MIRAETTRFKIVLKEMHYQYNSSVQWRRKGRHFNSTRTIRLQRFLIFFSIFNTKGTHFGKSVKSTVNLILRLRNGTGRPGTVRPETNGESRVKGRGNRVRVVGRTTKSL